MSKEDCFHLGVKVLIFNEKGQMLLLQLNPKKFDPTTESDEVIWDLPGGRINRGELLHEALKREVYEETCLESIENIQSVSIDLTDVRVPVGTMDVGLIYATYSCEIKGNHSIRTSKEHLSYMWVSPDEAASRLPLDFPSNLRAKLLGWVAI